MDIEIILERIHVKGYGNYGRDRKTGGYIMYMPISLGSKEVTGETISEVARKGYAILRGAKLI